MTDVFNVSSIAQVHELFSFAKPVHPLISVIRYWPDIDPINGVDFKEIKITSELYLMSMKGRMSGAFKYGRNSYDFEEGALVFVAPGQVLSFENTAIETDDTGWTILFHPDLIRRFDLGKTIKDYSFFNYDVNEALHLSEKEKQFLIELVSKIEIEINQTIDKHSHELVIHNLESILKYSNRYYDRQFYTRTHVNQDFVTQFEQYLDDYFASDQLTENGIPTVQGCGKALNISGPYLSDLLKLTTGKSAKTYIHMHIIDKAKTLLLSSSSPVSEIAFSLGFEYPQHFSKLFKSKTGISPSEYRTLN